MAALASKLTSPPVTPLMKDAKIGCRTSQWIAVVFLLMILTPPAHQLAHELGTVRQWRFLRLFQEFPTPVSLKRFEDNLARESVWAERTRAAYQALLIRALGQGTEKIVIGRDGFLFFRKEVDFAAGPGFLSRRVGPVRGISQANDFRKKSTDAIAVILDLKQDTHWSPAGLQVAVQRIADHLKPLLAPGDGLMLASRSEPVSHHGNLVRMLETEPKGNPFPQEKVEIAPVLEGGQRVKGGDDAPVLLLGDSFSNVYSRPDLGWGEGAGLGEQLMKALGARIQVIAQNGGGATGSRETLARKPQALRHKQVVLWTFSSRDLFDEAVAWDRVPLPEKQP